MSASSRFIAGTVAAAAIGGLVWWQLPHGHGAFFPQFRRQFRDQLWARVSISLRDEPAAAVPAPAAAPMPKLAALPSAKVYATALASGKEHPGATAFHADTDLYCEYNRKAVEDQARKEGITVAEVKELTFFGFAAMRASQRSKVEEVVGHPLSAEQAGKLDEIVQRENEAFTTQIRQKVDQGASEAERWALIRDFEQRFVDDYDRELGVTAAQFDQILAPDAAEAGGAMAVALPPQVQPPSEPAVAMASGPPQPILTSAPPGQQPPPASPGSAPSTSPPPAPPGGAK